MQYGYLLIQLKIRPDNMSDLGDICLSIYIHPIVKADEVEGQREAT